MGIYPAPDPRRELRHRQRSIRPLPAFDVFSAGVPAEFSSLEHFSSFDRLVYIQPSRKSVPTTASVSRRVVCFRSAVFYCFSGQTGRLYSTALSGGRIVVRSVVG